MSESLPPPLPQPLPQPSPEVVPETVSAGFADGSWKRVHPLTPLIRSWQAVAIVGFFVARDLGESWLRNDRGTEAGSGIPLPGRDVSLGVWLAGGGVLVVVLVAVIGLMVLSWRMTRYRVTADALELRRGVVFRQHRLAQLDRLQAVDVVQPLLARIFGLAKLTVEVAGAGHSAIELSYLSEARARAVRNHLLASAAGLDYAVTGVSEAPEAPEHHWLEVSPTRLLGSIALSSATVVLVISAIVLITVSLATGEVAPFAALLPAALGLGGGLWSRFSRGFGFRAAISPDGLRLRHGLLESRTQTVPPGRVQAVRLNQPLLWRRPAWWQVQVNVAGYGGGGDASQGKTETLLLPVGTRQEAIGVLAFVLPDLGADPDEHPHDLLEAALVGRGPGHGFVTSPRTARRLDWISWRRNGFRATRTALLIRRGVLTRSLVVVPHARTQSLGVTQGPLQRRWGLASFALHSTPGPITPVVEHLAEDVAAQLLSDQAERARQARAAAGPERWMRRP